MHSIRELMLDSRFEIPGARASILMLLLASLTGLGIAAGLGHPGSGSRIASAAPAAEEASSGALDQRQAHAPMLQQAAAAIDCIGTAEIHNRGGQPTVVAFIGWGEAPQWYSEDFNYAPRHVACSGIIAPGASWTMAAGDIPSDLQSGSFYSFSTANFSGDPGSAPRPVSSILCEALATGLVGDAERYGGFKLAFDIGGEEAPEFAGIPAAQIYGEPIEVIIRRDCDMGGGRRSAADYVALAGDNLESGERFGAASTSSMRMLPLLVSESPQLGSSFIQVQNLGVEWGQVEIWIGKWDKCLRKNICLVPSVAPGFTQTFDVSTCLEPGREGVGWMRSSQRMSVLVDTTKGSTVPSYTQGARGARGLRAGGILRSVQDRSTLLHLTNHDGTKSGLVEILFMRDGETSARIEDWICPRGGATVDLRDIPELPDGWRGEVQIRSLMRYDPSNRPIGWTPISGIVSVVEHPAQQEPVPIHFDWMETLDGPATDADASLHRLWLPIVWGR